MSEQNINIRILYSKRASTIVGVSLIVLSAFAVPTRWWAFAYVFFLPIAAALLVPVVIKLASKPEVKEAYLAKILYKQNLRKLKNQVQNLQSARSREINRLTRQRKKTVTNDMWYDLAEGIVRINGKGYEFSEIKGAKINRQESSQIVKQKYKYSTFMGGPLFGQQELISETKQVCTHLGVIANMNGFETEVVLINHPTDVESFSYRNAEKTANYVLSTLQELAQTPVPVTYVPVEEEHSVKALDAEIAKAVSTYNTAAGESKIEKAS